MLILGIGSILGIAQPAIAQMPKDSTEIQDGKTSQENTPIPQPTLPKTINGKVIWEDQQPLPNVAVFLKGSDIKTTTDEQGIFSLDLSEAQLSSNDTIVFSYIGFITKELPIGSENAFKEVEIMADYALLNETAVVGSYCLEKRNFFQKMGDFFSSPFKKKHHH